MSNGQCNVQSVSAPGDWLALSASIGRRCSVWRAISRGAALRSSPRPLAVPLPVTLLMPTGLTLTLMPRMRTRKRTPMPAHAATRDRRAARIDRRPSAGRRRSCRVRARSTPCGRRQTGCAIDRSEWDAVRRVWKKTRYRSTTKVVMST